MSTDLAALPASKHARRSLTNIPRNVSTAALRVASVHTAWSEMSVRMEKFAVHYLRDYFEIKFRCHQVKKNKSCVQSETDNFNNKFIDFIILKRLKLLNPHLFIADGYCVEAKECPCKIGGQTYRPGTALSVDCQNW